MRDLEQKIALHEQAARRFREQADQLTDQVKHNAEAFAAVVARWRALTHQPTRIFAEAHELAQLERSIPTLSQQIARIRRQWTDCVAAAREQEDAAEQLRAQLHQ
jgi:chromosome segregation ATPase